MKKIRSFITMLIIAGFFLINPSYSQQSMLQQGEELLYEVSFFGIKLGSIKMITEGFQDYNGKQVIKLKAFIDSYKGIPFVDLHAIFESWSDPSLAYSDKFASNTKGSDGWYFEQAVFNYPEKKIQFDAWKGKAKDRSSTVSTNRHWNDGCSLFFAARKMLHSGKNIKIPTMIDHDTVNTTIHFMNKVESTEIDAVNYPIRTKYFSGKADWTGIYGLSGGFEGWFSDDVAAVPIKAKMKVYVGNVDITLIQYKRAGWTPPKAN